MNDDLDKAVAAALESGNWDEVIVLANDLYLEAADNDVRGAVMLAEALKDTLSKAQKNDDPKQADAITQWVELFTANLAVVRNNPGQQITWRTMKDSKVREMHQKVEGVTITVGETFDVGGYNLHFPGEPVGPPEVWYNCRCSAFPESVTAALSSSDDDEPHTSSVLVAVPAEGDPVWGMGPEDKHVTLVFLGETEVPEGLGQELADYATALSDLIEVPVTGVDTLGPEDEEQKAQVLLLAPDVPSEIRAGLLEILGKHGLSDASEWPTYLPHVTLGYDDPENFEVPDTPESITFDRLALWTPQGKFEFPFIGEPKTVAASAVAEVEEPTEEELEDAAELDDIYAGLTFTDPLPWHGILVVEGEPSGDRRKFEVGSLSNRPLPLPITAKHTNEDTWETIGRIDRIWKVGTQVWGEGVFDHANPVTDIAIGQIADRMQRGLSVEVDDADGYRVEFEDDDTWYGDVFSKGRICSVALVPVPAYHQAFIALGPAPDEDESLVASLAVSGDPVTFASEAKWDGSASRFTPEQWKRSCILHTCDGEEKSCHKLPIREPGGALSRAGVHAAAARINQVNASSEQKAKAKAALRGAYKELGEEVPDVIALSMSWLDPIFKRGPGWITDPVPTRRIHSYWTRPGQPGYIKIGWGAPGDFYRCRNHLAKYVNPLYLNRTCAEWHHDALGIWPGEHDGPLSASLVAAIAPVPAERFGNPHLSGPTPITITEDGHVFGHVSTWDQCHIGYGKCTTAPHSASNYAWFHTGAVLTDQGLVAVGHLTLGIGHAKGKASAQQAVEHYDNTKAVVAYVCAGEDAYGIWFSGIISPAATDEQVFQLQGGAISGDWRMVKPGQYEMVGALVVNVPGFPIPRMAVTASADGDLWSLTAAAVVEPNRDERLLALRTSMRDIRVEEFKRALALTNRED